MPDTVIDQHELRPAASLILVRDQPGGLQVLMVTRAAGMAFAAGASVFPGGRVDDADFNWGKDHAAADAGDGIGPHDAAHRFAAARELFEEVGILLCAGTPVQLRDAQIALAPSRAGVEAVPASFPTLLESAGLQVDLLAITPFANWIPPRKIARRYNTQFFVARMPDAQVPQPDGGEALIAEWLKPSEAVRMANSGERRVLFPTHMNLTRLAQYTTVEALLAASRAQPIVPICPRVEQRRTGAFLCIPEGAGYPETAVPMNRVVRDELKS